MYSNTSSNTNSNSNNNRNNSNSSRLVFQNLTEVLLDVEDPGGDAHEEQAA